MSLRCLLDISEMFKILNKLLKANVDEYIKRIYSRSVIYDIQKLKKTSVDLCCLDSNFRPKLQQRFQPNAVLLHRRQQEP